MLVKLCYCSAKCIKYWIYYVRKAYYGKKDDELFSMFSAIMWGTIEIKTIFNIYEAGWKTDFWNLLIFFNYLHQMFQNNRCTYIAILQWYLKKRDQLDSNSKQTWQKDQNPLTKQYEQQVMTYTKKCIQLLKKLNPRFLLCEYCLEIWIPKCCTFSSQILTADKNLIYLNDKTLSLEIKVLYIRNSLKDVLLTKLFFFYCLRNLFRKKNLKHKNSKFAFFV